MSASIATQKAPDVEYTKAKSSGKKADAVAKIVKAYRGSKDPLLFSVVCAKAGAKYPQDVEAAMFALELTGQIERLDAKASDSNRKVTAYRWVA